jgi:hypothetical protein
MPAPFGPIIRNGLDGTWELKDIRAALGGLSDAKPPTAPKPVHVAPATPAVAEQKALSAPAKPSMQPEAQLSLPLLDEDRKAEFAHAATRENIRGRENVWDRKNFRDRKDAWGEEQSFSLGSRWLGAAGMVALLLLLSTWALVHAWNAHRHNAAQTAAASQSAGQSGKQIPANPSTRPRVSLASSAGSRADWRVIPFTYSHRTDAEKKAASLARSHPELKPAVFTPNGRAPYLVSIGGVMDRDAAYALGRRSRSLGLPHDTYAQNYSH